MHSKVRAVLKNANAQYFIRRHNEYTSEIRSPYDFAQALGYDVERIAKSVFLCSCGQPRTYAIVVLSANKIIDLKKIAEYLCCGRVQMASKEDLKLHTDYPPTGVSPLGIGSIPIFIDAALLAYPTIVIGSGEVALEIEIAPDTVQQLTSGRIVAFSNDVPVRK